MSQKSFGPTVTPTLPWDQVSREAPCVVAMGNFDGVHLGHRAILENLVNEGTASGLAPVLLTFEPHPRHYFRPQDKTSLLTTPTEKLQLLGQWPIAVIPLAFDASLAALEPESFVEDFLKARLRGKRFLLGYDHRFGKGARGDVHLMRAHVENPERDVLVLEPFRLDGELVSSSAIRACLEAADMEKAHRLLGRPFRYSGVVKLGDQRGRQLGFPTANLDLGHDRKAIVAYGVYGGIAQVGGKAYPAVANIGKTPTFDGQDLKIEVHILDFSEDIYRQWVDFDLLFHLRPEQKFSDVESLRNQIGQDVKNARLRLAKV